MYGLLELSGASTEILLVAAGALVAYKVAKALNAPLAHVPGPWYSRFTELVHTVSIAQGKAWSDVIELHRTYGPIVRLGPNRISVTDVASLETVLGANGFHKGEIYQAFIFARQNNIVSTSDPVAHKRLKKMMAPVFSTVSVQKLEPLILDVGVQKVVNILEKSSADGTPVDMFKLMMHMTLDIISTIAFGGSFNLLESESVPIMGWLHSTTMLGIGRTLFGNTLAPMIFRKYQREYEMFIEHTIDMIERRRKQKDPPKDILQALIEAVDEDTGMGLSTEEIASNAFILMGVILLLTHPECMKCLVSEIDEAIPSIGEPITHAKVQNLPYLNAILQETLRLRCPAGVDLPRKVSPQGANLCNLFIPGGTEITLLYNTIMQDERNFDNPNTFAPDRWLASPEEVSETKRAFLPFSAGPRVCLGRALAWMELRVTMATLLRKFEFELVPNQDLRPVSRLALEPADGKAMVMVTKRTV
ncbi:cytochrome P450 [Thamnocephalis sphaerospora]|uniref:Cytochrome P450 n=1 Tax=Thamnocephalis sphaerospora TaxID=78915 RepID=A0A4P9XPP0_9FUNG|nr:cytochrome P450 [Thamnocephalis sphaerospora]|eukprot:RKP07966.1 cytochrome P450 [Thamnocephalis sphaerospora]